uniref:Immunoglobulin domain-containing protein n=1 Tax=Cyprinus carpio TaxID=7962 RepID=A0A8C1T4I4_CYPCA
MKEIFKIFQFLLLMYGVFGADEDEVKSVSVMEGDSVTLNPDLTHIQGFNQILWRFGSQGSTIASIVGKVISYEEEEIFRDRLELDQTGSLTIKNMRTKHSGRYKAEINHSTGTLLTIFIVTVYVSPDVIDAAKGEMKLMSVMEGGTVTLDVPQLTGDELIVWRFGDEEKLIAKHDLEAKSPPLYDDTAERFRDRLKLNDQTGSLTITNTRTTDSGVYKVKISSNKQTLYKRFTVTVSERGLSGGAVAGIVVGVLLLAAAAAGVMYFYLRLRTTNLPNQTWSVLTEDCVIINPDTKIQRGDEIQWLFEDTIIAEIKEENREKTPHKGPDERFKNRLYLDETTGSLTIRNIKTEDKGLYTLKIRRGREILHKRFIVFVRERMRPVMEGDPTTLHPETEIQKGDEIQWLFGDKERTVLAEIKNTEVTKYDGTDKRFRDGLQLDKEAFTLTITNTTAAHNGYYTLKITRGRDKIYKRFHVYVKERRITVLEGKSVTLNPARKINNDDVIEWLFGDEEQQTLIAEINGKAGEIFIYDDDADERFRDRLELDKTTGSLTINNTRTEHSGVYKLEIRSSSGDSEQTFTVIVREKVEEKLLKRGDSVTLKPDTKIQRDDQILWMFGDQDKLIAQIRGGTVDDDVNERFRGRLKLDKMTGSLTITDIEAEHSGLYKLQIISSSRGILCKKFKVSIKQRNEEVTAGDPVHLNTALNEIQRDDEIQWRFGKENSLIAEIKGGTGVTHDVPDERFRDRLELDEKTGDLIIKNSTAEHAGRYKLKIRSSKGNTYRTYTVTIKVRFVEVAAGESVRLNTALTEIQRGDEIQWRFGKENSLIAEIKEGTGVTHDVPDERFRDRLELDEKTGDLTIKNSTTKHAGYYKLKISSRKGNTTWKYSVNIRGAAVTKEARTESSMKEKTDSRRNRVNESATVEMPLLNGDDLDVLNEEEGTS